MVKFITEDAKVKHPNITTKLKLKLNTKVIKMPSRELGFDRQREKLKVRGSASALMEHEVENLS